MAPPNNDDQFKFLISCIRYSNNGKVDFDLVAEECSIVSKGAAAKRYERMMKAHGIHQSQTSTVENIRNSTVPTRGKKTPTAGPSRGRKRKADQGMESNLNEDDEEDFADVKPKVSRKKVKTEAHVNKLDNWLVKEDVVDEQAATEFVKEEPAMEEDTGTFMIENAYGKAQRTASIPQVDGVEDRYVLNDFVAFGASTTPAGNGGKEMQESIVIAD